MKYKLKVLLIKNREKQKYCNIMKLEKGKKEREGGFCLYTLELCFYQNIFYLILSGYGDGDPILLGLRNLPKPSCQS